MSKEEIFPFPTCEVDFYIFFAQFLSGLALTISSAEDQNQEFLSLSFQSGQHLLPLSPSIVISIFPIDLLLEIRGSISDVLT